MFYPFKILIDTREQLPFSFAGIHSGRGSLPLSVETIRRAIPSGDYSIDGHESRVAIERKSLPDLFHSIGQDRQRFKREIERLAAMRFAAVVVEADWRTILESPPPHTRLTPKIVYRTIISWKITWPSVHWEMCPGRRFAEITTFRLLERWWYGLHKEEKRRDAMAADNVKEGVA